VVVGPGYINKNSKAGVAFTHLRLNIFEIIN